MTENIFDVVVPDEALAAPAFELMPSGPYASVLQPMRPRAAAHASGAARQALST